MQCEMWSKHVEIVFNFHTELPEHCHQSPSVAPVRLGIAPSTVCNLLLSSGKLRTEAFKLSCNRAQLCVMRPRSQKSTLHNMGGTGKSNMKEWSNHLHLTHLQGGRHATFSACSLFYGSKICCDVLHGALPMVSWSRAPCSPHCLHRCTTFYLHFVLHYNHLQVTQEEHKHPEQRSPESGGEFGRLAEQFPVTSYEPNTFIVPHTPGDIHAMPTSRRTSFCWYPRQPVKVGKKLDESLASPLLTQDREPSDEHGRVSHS